MTEKLFPSMRMEELFAVEALQSILYRDSSLTTRSMTFYEESPSGIRNLFDGIAYSKCEIIAIAPTVKFRIYRRFSLRRFCRFSCKCYSDVLLHSIGRNISQRP